MPAPQRSVAPKVTRPKPSRGKPQQAGDKFASLTADLLARDESTIITRSDVRQYDHEGAKASHLEPQKIAVTFRMQQTEFFRLRKGADKIGVKPRDIVHRAIKNCLDAYGVAPPVAEGAQRRPNKTNAREDAEPSVNNSTVVSLNNDQRVAAPPAAPDGRKLRAAAARRKPVRRA